MERTANLLAFAANLAAPNNAECAIVLVEVLRPPLRSAVFRSCHRIPNVPMAAYEIETERQPFS
jgi:hypothetical protein